jgi:hypothetical protein
LSHGPRGFYCVSAVVAINLTWTCQLVARFNQFERIW